MENKRIRFILTIALTAIYNFFFWHQMLGINMLIFSIQLMGVLFFLNRESFKSTNVLIASAGTLFSGITILLYNSDIAKFAHLTSLLILTGFIHQSSLRSINNAILTSLSSLFHVFSNYKRESEE